MANQAAYTEGDAWLDQRVVYIDANHDYAEPYIREKMPLVSYRRPKGPIWPGST